MTQSSSEPWDAGRTPEPFHGRQVEALAAYGVTEADIARVLAIDPKTLRKDYREELDTGSVKATAKVAEFLFRKATTDGPQCITAATFWLKTRAGWRETVQDHRVGIVDLTSLSDAELMRVARTRCPDRPRAQPQAGTGYTV